MLHNQLIQKILKKCRLKAEKDKEYKRIEISETYPEMTTGVIFTPDDLMLIETAGQNAEKKYLNDEIGCHIEEFKKMIQSDSWKFFEELMKNQELPDIEGATYTEKQAFNGFRKQVIEELLTIPHRLIEFVKE